VIADQEWKTVQIEDRQNQELLHLSQQILQPTKEVRSYADTIQREDDQNRELLDLSKQTLARARHSPAPNASTRFTPPAETSGVRSRRNAANAASGVTPGFRSNARNRCACVP
jgi:hypothetical protein